MGTKSALSPSSRAAALSAGTYLHQLRRRGRVDVLEFSHAGTANVQLKCRLVKIEEGQDKRVHVALIEHSPTLDALRNSVISPPPGCAGEDCEPPEDDPGDTDPGTCEEARGGTGSLVAWFNGGGPYAPGTYFISARRPASNRHCDALRDPGKHLEGRYHGGAPPVRCRYPSCFWRPFFESRCDDSPRAYGRGCEDAANASLECGQ